MSSPLSVLHSAYTSCDTLTHQSCKSTESALGIISFSRESMTGGALGSTELPLMQVNMPVLSGNDAACEVWSSNAILHTDSKNGLRYRYSDNLLFGVIELAEASISALASETPLQHATETAYKQILTLLRDLNYPFVYRFWNYLADINGVSHGLERYRQFNLGRQDAFLACGREVAGGLPAACALGVNQGALKIAFLAGQVKATAIENPRQISAYQYPQQYGPRSPTFSRANLLCLPQQEILFLSGTASIVGHETVHHGDAKGQTREAMANLQALVNEANNLSKKKFELAEVFYRIYVRHAEDVLSIQNEMSHIIGAAFKATFLRADICRQDLLLEIEATLEHPI
jgi:chorismate lyase/3-hydroxybenzoate synthase